MKEKFNKDETFLARWLSGELSETELREFEASEDFEAFKKIAEEASHLKTPSWKSKEESWKAFKEKTASTQKNPPAKIRRLNRRWFLAAAAIGLLLIGYFSLFRNTTQVFSTPMASQKTFTLPDGSEVILNALSKIEFDKNDFMENRTLELSGEAFFKVKKGSKFLVKTDNGSVQVLGTTFNVFSRKNKLQVECYEGKVGVFFEKPSIMKTVMLGSGITAIDKKITEEFGGSILPVPNWTIGNSRFENVNFVEVIEELERQFDIRINYPKELEDAEKNYVGGFPHNDLETALEITFSSVGYKYKINGKEVSVFK